MTNGVTYGALRNGTRFRLDNYYRDTTHPLTNWNSTLDFCLTKGQKALYNVGTSLCDEDLANMCITPQWAEDPAFHFLYYFDFFFMTKKCSPCCAASGSSLLMNSKANPLLSSDFHP